MFEIPTLLENSADRSTSFLSLIRLGHLTIVRLCLKPCTVLRTAKRGWLSLTILHSVGSAVEVGRVARLAQVATAAKRYVAC